MKNQFARNPDNTVFDTKGLIGRKFDLKNRVARNPKNTDFDLKNQVARNPENAVGRKFQPVSERCPPGR